MTLRATGVSLLLLACFAAIGLFGVLAQLPHASAAHDRAGVHTIMWIGAGSAALVVACLAGAVLLLFRRR